MDLALNNLKRLICHKTQPTNPTNIYSKINIYLQSVYITNIIIPSKQLELQVTVPNTNNLPLYGINYSNQCFNTSIWQIDGIPIGSITPGQSGPGSNGKEEVLHIPHWFRTGASPPWFNLLFYSGHSFFCGSGFCKSHQQSLNTEVSVE